MNEFDNIVFNEDSFTLVNEDKKISDQKFQTKPTTYLKDAVKRFRKNKSSVAGAFILGLIIILTIFIPMLSPKRIDEPRVAERFLAPKLFNAGFGFWDGVVEKKAIYDNVNNVPADHYAPAVSELVVDTETSFINRAHQFAFGGNFWFRSDYKNAILIDETTTSYDYGTNYLLSYPTTMTSTGGYKVEIDLLNEAISEIEDEIIEDIPTTEEETGNLLDKEVVYELGEYRVGLQYGEGPNDYIVLKDYSTDYSKFTLDISKALADNNLTSVENAQLRFDLKAKQNVDTYILIKNCIFTSTEPNSELAKISIKDANQSALYAKDANGTPVGYWTCNGWKNVYKAEVYYCSFEYDTYKAVYDLKRRTIAMSTINDYIKAGYLKLEIKSINKATKEVEFEYEILSDECPIDAIEEVKINVIGKPIEVVGGVYRFKEYGYNKMPRFLFGTDSNGHDIVKKAFSGLRTSLILGLCTSAFCLLFGLCWGAISGYFGGNIDLAMERFCEILSGVPWIVVMTLAILHLGNNFVTFFLALCLTGWMGVAARTRTQFYRFKGREYILASRTLGSSDRRLIFRHILPNALGTIVTSSVLMIPSTIFSEATLAYLNLGLQGVDSFGVLMSENQVYIATQPHLIAFPAVIMALLMISFNLFGNGLRDALNPSLKGSE